MITDFEKRMKKITAYIPGELKEMLKETAKEKEIPLDTLCCFILVIYYVYKDKFPFDKIIDDMKDRAKLFGHISTN